MIRVVKCRQEINRWKKKRREVSECTTLWNWYSNNIKKLEDRIKDIKATKDLVVCSCGSDSIVETYRCRSVWSMHGASFICDDDRDGESGNVFKCGRCGKRISKMMMDELEEQKI